MRLAGPAFVLLGSLLLAGFCVPPVEAAGLGSGAIGGGYTLAAFEHLLSGLFAPSPGAPLLALKREVPLAAVAAAQIPTPSTSSSTATATSSSSTTAPQAKVALSPAPTIAASTLTVASVNRALATLRTQLEGEIAAARLGATGIVYETSHALGNGDSHKTLNELTVNGLTGLTDADIPDTITASNYLPLAGGIVSGNLSLTGSISADLSAGTVIASGSTESRSLAVRAGDVVNVKDFGARGDGTTDDTAAIASAFAALGSGKGTIFVPPGDYLINNASVPFTINNFSGQLLFAGGARLLFRDNSKGGIWFVGGTGAQFLNLHVGYQVTPTVRVQFQQAIKVDTATDPTFENVIVDSSPAIGLQFKSSIRPKVVNAQITNTQADGLGFYDSQDPQATNITISNTGDDGLSFVSSMSGTGYTGGNASNITIKNSHARGINIAGQSYVTISNFSIATTSSSGILIQQDTVHGGNPVHDVSVSQGVIIGAGTYAPATGNTFGIDYERTTGILSLSNITIIGGADRGLSGSASTGKLQASDIHVTNNLAREGVDVSAQEVVLRNITTADTPSYGVYVGSSGNVDATNITTINAALTDSLHRAVWFQGNTNVTAGGIHVIDDQVTATGYIVGESSNTRGSISDVQAQIANGSLSINNLSAGVTISQFGVFNTSGTTGGFQIDGNLILLASSTLSSLAVGQSALNSAYTGTGETALGFEALKTLSSGSGNTAAGYRALKADTTGANNSAIGWGALTLNMTGSGNVAAGQSALAVNTTGSANTAVGTGAWGNLVGSNNVALGRFAGNSQTVGSSNIAIGTNVDLPNLIGSQQLNVGNILYATGLYNGSTMSSAPVLNGNVGIGTTTPYAQLSIQALSGSTNRVLFAIASSTPLATTTLFAVLNNGNVGIGTTSPAGLLGVAGDIYSSGVFNTSGTTGGFQIDGNLVLTASSTLTSTVAGIGLPTLTSAGVANTSFGYQALGNATSTANNTAVGYQALQGGSSLYTGNANTAIGYQALKSVTTGINNSALGWQAGLNITTANAVVAIGLGALSSHNGNQNVGIGNSTLAGNGNGAANTAIGYLAGTSDTSGAKNVFVGAFTASTTASGSNNIALGYDIALPSTNGSNQLDIGNLIFGTGINGEGTTLSTGNIGIGTTTPWRTLDVNGTVGFKGLSSVSATQTAYLCLSANNEVVQDSTTCLSSSARFKQNIAPLSASSSLAEVMALTPVSFQYTPQYNGNLQSNPNFNGTFVGFIAEQVAQVDDRLITVDATGSTPTAPHGVRYENITAILAGAVQEIAADLASLKATVAGFAQRITTQEADVQKLCVGDVCVTQDQFLRMVQQSGQTPTVASPTEQSGQGSADASSTPAAPDTIESSTPDQTDSASTDASSTPSN